MRNPSPGSPGIPLPCSSPPHHEWGCLREALAGQAGELLGPEKAAALLQGHPPGDLVIAPPGGTYAGPPHGIDELSRNLEAIRWLQDEPDSGSNNWLSTQPDASENASGGRLHRPLDTPNCYYQNHIACPEFDAIGLSFPGVPGFPTSATTPMWPGVSPMHRRLPGSLRRTFSAEKTPHYDPGSGKRPTPEGEDRSQGGGPAKWKWP